MVEACFYSLVLLQNLANVVKDSTIINLQQVNIKDKVQILKCRQKDIAVRFSHVSREFNKFTAETNLKTIAICELEQSVSRKVRDRQPKPKYFRECVIYTSLSFDL